MERIPERELMDNPDNARAYAEADFSEAHDAFVAHFRNSFPHFSKGSVLDLGCGAGDVIIRFARAIPLTEITGIDGSHAMLDIGNNEIKSKGFSDKIKLIKCRLPDKELFMNKYDAIISNSLLHHLKDPMMLWDTIRKCARQGTHVFIMDLMRPDRAEKAKEIVLLNASEASPLVQEDFYNSLLAAYTTEEIKKQLLTAGLEYFNIHPVTDRHMTIWGTL